MRTSILIPSLSSVWLMSVIYYNIEVNTGIEFRPLLYAAVLVMIVGLVLGCRNDKETTKEEA